MALAALNALFSPSTTQQGRVQPPRNAKKKLDKDYVYDLPKELQPLSNSIDLGSTVTASQFDSLSPSNRVIDTQPILQGNDSIVMSSPGQSAIPESQNSLNISEISFDSPEISFNNVESTCTPPSRRGTVMFAALSQTLSDMETGQSLLPMSDDVSLLRSDSPPSSTSAPHDVILQQLVDANIKITQLEMENSHLKDELNILATRSAQNLATDRPPQMAQQTQTIDAEPSVKNTQTEPLHPTAASTQTDSVRNEHNRETLLFRSDGSLSVLSNFYRAHIHFDGRRYPSAEHAYQHQMALHHSRPDIAHRIMMARTPAQAKRVAKSIQKTEQWHECKTTVMSTILSEKARQCQHFKDALLGTKEKRLLHNIDTDNFWGCGSDLNGANMMGVLLEDLRKELVANPIPTSASSADPSPVPNPSRTLSAAVPGPPPVVTSASSDPPSPDDEEVPNSEPVLIIGNSNARKMASTLGTFRVNGNSYCYPGGTIDYVKSRVCHTSRGMNPSHVVLMASDIEAANGLNSNVINAKLEGLVRETQHVYPWSRIILVGPAMAGSSQRRQTIQRINAWMQHLAAHERTIHYVRNQHAKLRDNIHLTQASKVSLCKSIAMIVTKPHLNYLQRF